MMDLVLVAKHWTPGKAKTRLASRIGAEAAAELSRLFLIASLSHFAGLGERHWLAFTPIEERQAFQELITDKVAACAASCRDFRGAVASDSPRSFLRWSKGSDLSWF